MPIDNSMAFQRLDIYVAAKEIARLVNEARITHTELRDQAQRASISCFLQLAEGYPTKDRECGESTSPSPTTLCTSSLPQWPWPAHWGRSRPSARRPSRNWASGPTECSGHCSIARPHESDPDPSTLSGRRARMHLSADRGRGSRS